MFIFAFLSLNGTYQKNPIGSVVRDISIHTHGHPVALIFKLFHFSGTKEKRR